MILADEPTAEIYQPDFAAIVEGFPIWHLHQDVSSKTENIDQFVT